MSQASEGWQDASARTRKPSSWRLLLGIETRSKGKPTSAGVACDNSPGLSVFFSKESHGLPSPANAMLDLVASTMRRVNADRQCLILSACDTFSVANQALSRVAKLSRACASSALSRLTSSATGGASLIWPIPWPEPQMSRQAFDFM